MKRSAGSQVLVTFSAVFSLIGVAWASSPRQLDRRPGILEEPSQRPTGDQAHLYDFLVDGWNENAATSEEAAAK